MKNNRTNDDERKKVMGMSASQARFLSLTARKNNVEFEGQQINQQRTTLSNESASYYSELCNMEVPTPPSVDDYTKVAYSFNDGAMTNTIISLLPKTDPATGAPTGKYSINYVEEWQDDYAIVSAASSLVEKRGGDFYIGSSKLREMSESSYVQIGGNYYKTTTKSRTEYPVGSGTYVQYISSSAKHGATGQPYAAGDNYDFGGASCQVKDDGTGRLYFELPAGTPFSGTGTYTSYELIEDQTGWTPKGQSIAEQLANIVSGYFGSDPGEYVDSLTDKQKAALMETEKYYLAMLRDKIGDDAADFDIRYVLNTTTGNYEPYFYAKSELENEAKYNNKNLAAIPCYSLGSTTQTREVLNQTGTIEKDSSGRYVAITLELEDGSTRTYNLTTTTTTDEEAYNDAMNQYVYKQHEYDHKVQEINSKLEIVQQQDKQLELKLKQLDTEENAISTEMDAVKKVISKNVESSFKTFNA